MSRGIIFFRTTHIAPKRQLKKVISLSMKPPVEILRISKQARDQLTKLKRQTGIDHWNILCRLAFCISLAENEPPSHTNEKLEGGIEMSWKIFSGDHSDVYSGLLCCRAAKDGYAMENEELLRCLRAHIQRGLNYLASGYDASNLYSFTEKWLSTP